MEPNDVLKYFIDSCNDRSQYFQCSLASNAVLDWFGRSFRSNKKIEQYLRYEIWPQYEQNFTNAIPCGPIETKSSHSQTKQMPIENSHCQIVFPCTLNASSFESPKKIISKLNNPPPLTRGKRFRCTVEDSPRTKAYNLRGSGSDSSPEISSPAKNLRKRIQTHDSVEINSPIKRNRLTARECDLISTPTRSSSRCIDSAYRSSASERTTCDNTHSIASCSSPKTFSELKYLESIGSIRTIRRNKHPGINKVPTMQTDTPTPFVSPESQNGWDRKTKLKLSYRIGAQCTDDIQFALIIYEPLTMVTRRNLLNEFQKAAEEDAAIKLNSNTKSQSAKKDTNKNKLRSEKISSLRRLRF